MIVFITKKLVLEKNLPFRNETTDFDSILTVIEIDFLTYVHTIQGGK